MAKIDVPKVRGKIAERGLTLTALSKKIGISRNTLANYLEFPEKMPYGVMSDMAEILCDTPEEATIIFFASNLLKK